MALLKSQKMQLAETYLQHLKSGVNVTVLSFDKIPVNEINKLRMDVADAQGVLEVVKKRVLLKVAEGKFDGLTLEQAASSLILLYSNNTEDAYAPLKTVHKYIKKRTKEAQEYNLSYIGGWFDNEWKMNSRVKELAALPTKEELVAKFLFLLNHPVSSLARAFQAIADKKGQE